MSSNESSLLDNFLSVLFGLIVILLIGKGFHEMGILIPVLLSIGLYYISLLLIQRYNFVYYIFPVFIALVFEFTDIFFWEGADGYLHLLGEKENEDSYSWYNSPHFYFWWLSATVIYGLLTDYTVHQGSIISSTTYRTGYYIISKNKIKPETKTAYSYDSSADEYRFHSMIILLHVVSIILYAVFKTVFS
jgi:hypothetical protein